MTRHRICHRDELPPGQRRIVDIDGRSIGVFNIGGRFYAVLNRCADQAGPVCEGGLFERMTAEVTPEGRVRRRIEDDGCILACPWHGWEYDVRTGRCLWNPALHLRTFEVDEDPDGQVSVLC